MYKDTLFERTIWLALGALAIWGARHAGCQLLLTRQAQKRQVQLAKELEQLFKNDADLVRAAQKQHDDGWEKYGENMLARFREAVKQERAELADRVYVRTMVREAVERVIERHYRGVANEIQALRAVTLAANERNRQSIENTKDMQEDRDVNAEAFRHYGFQQGFGGSWVLPPRV